MAPQTTWVGYVARVAAWVERAVVWAARHWLALVNAALAIYVTLPFLAPVLMAWGWTGLGRAIYLAYVPFCHQLPERSFFLFGQQWVYSLADLQALGLPPDAGLWERKFFLGNAVVGYKMAFCQRDLALYGALWLTGLVYGWRGRRWRPLAWRWYLLSLAPMAVDGGTQLLMLRESTWALRLVTGALMGVTTVWALYPRLNAAIAEALAPPPREAPDRRDSR